eukprot:6217570-Amphidinium_carterae.1
MELAAASVAAWVEEPSWVNQCQMLPLLQALAVLAGWPPESPAWSPSCPVPASRTSAVPPASSPPQEGHDVETAPSWHPRNLPSTPCPCPCPCVTFWTRALAVLVPPVRVELEDLGAAPARQEASAP